MSEDTEFVSLNVGGVKFVTTKTTLLMKGSSQPSSFFSALVGGTNPILAHFSIDFRPSSLYYFSLLTKR